MFVCLGHLDVLGVVGGFCAFLELFACMDLFCVFVRFGGVCLHVSVLGFVLHLCCLLHCCCFPIVVFIRLVVWAFWDLCLHFGMCFCLLGCILML